MYEQFFGLEDEPFRLTPDPRYLFLSPKHAEALAHLRLGLTESSGFVCITGDVGTGKTTLLRTFLSELGPGVAAVYTFVPPLSAHELVRRVCREFGLPASNQSQGELVEELHAYLVAQHAAGRLCVVVLDEAQALSIELLEQVRLLLNLETETHKLLRIVLVGQPQLGKLLLDPGLAQLNQRITLRWHLGPLSYRETAAYVAHRLAVASSGRAPRIFTRPALRLLYSVSGGVPRLINMIGHRALLAAFVAREPRVGRRFVARAYHEIQAVPLPGTLSRGRQVAFAALGLAFGAGLVVFGGPSLDRLLNARSRNDANLHGDPAYQGLEMGEIAAAGAPPPQGPTERGAGSLENTPHQQQPSSLSTAANAAPKEERAAATVRNTGPIGDAPRTEAIQAAAPVPEPVQVAALPADPSPVLQEFKPTSPQAPPSPTAVEAPRAELQAPPAVNAAIAPLPPLKAVRSSSAAELARRLGSVDQNESAQVATAAILASWGVRPLATGETQLPNDLDAAVWQGGLQELSLTGNRSMLRLLDLPALISLRVPGEKTYRYVALIGMEGSQVVLSIAGARVTIDADLLDGLWSGEAHVLWRDFEGLGRPLHRGARGIAVLRLQELLTRMGVLQGRPSGEFDTATEMAVLNFQRAHLLDADGVVGPITRIVMYATAGGYQRPTLAVRGSTTS